MMEEKKNETLLEIKELESILSGTQKVASGCGWCQSGNPSGRDYRNCRGIRIRKECDVAVDSAFERP